MKNYSTFKKVSWAMIVVLGLSFFASCDSDDESTPEPVASFQYEANENNGLEITFTNYSENATSYVWDFGDGTGTSTDENVTYSYADGGTYTVTLTATNEAGSAEHSKEVTVVNTMLPVAEFSFEVSDENPLEVAFTSQSPTATSFEWDFGDGNTSTDANPTYEYSEGNTYAVTLNVSNEYGSASTSKDVTVVNPTDVNLVENGGFDDESAWSIIQHNPNNNGMITIADGVAVFEDVEQADWGSEAHVGLNQPITVDESGNYQFNLDITTGAIDQIFFEVWIGTGEPVELEDYNEENNATKVLSFNTWDCGENNINYSGPMAPVSCQDTDGSVTLEPGDYFLVIRGGGITWDTGITIDNVSIYKAD